MYANTTPDMCVAAARARWSVTSPFAAKRTAVPTIQVSLNGKHGGRPMASGGSSG
jgi:hypothetical protein